jgi:hypothetical protein
MLYTNTVPFRIFMDRCTEISPSPTPSLHLEVDDDDDDDGNDQRYVLLLRGTVG